MSPGGVHLLLCLLVAQGAMGREWYSYDGMYYWFSMWTEPTMTWQAAREKCMSIGGDLTSILNDGERDFIHNKISDETSYRGEYWIGLNALEDKTNFRWSDGSQAMPSFWDSGKPEMDSTVGLLKMCVAQNMELLGQDKKPHWENEPCGLRFSFVCKSRSNTNTPVTEAPPVTVPGYCPSGYIMAGEKCYKMVFLEKDTPGVTWKEAVRLCRAEQAGRWSDIATVSDQLTSAVLGAQIHEYTKGLWVGLYRQNKAALWNWADNHDNRDGYTNWGENQPNVFDLDNCVELWHTPGPPGTWNNIDCDTKRGYVCQTYKDPSNVIPTPMPTPDSNCPNEYVPYAYGCYKFDKVLRTWEEAQANCASERGNLVSIHDHAENWALTAEATIYESPIWIGLRNKKDGGEYSWSDTWAVFYTNWGNHEPSDAGGCVVMKDDGKWYDTDCDYKYASFCKRTDAPPITTPSHSEGSCPGDDTDSSVWTPYGDYCYFASDPDGILDKDKVNWRTAKETCLKMHYQASLVTIHSKAENEFLATIADTSLINDDSYWTGMYRRTSDGDFAWLDGSAVQYTNWAPGEPNGENAGEECVEYYTSGYPKMWNDVSCSKFRSYICKVPKQPVVTKEPAVEGSCDEGWEAWGGHCYMFFPNQLGYWQTAVDKCQELGGPQTTLPTISSYWENEFIRTKMDEVAHLPEKTSYWIGLIKDGPGTDGFYWMDGTAFDEDSYSMWAPGEPNDLGGTEHCTEMYYQDGKWNDIYCDATRAFLCKKPKTPPPTEASTALTAGATAGVVIAAIVGVVLLLAIIFFILSAFGIVDMGKHVQDTKSFMGFSNEKYDEMEKPDGDSNA